MYKIDNDGSVWHTITYKGVGFKVNNYINDAGLEYMYQEYLKRQEKNKHEKKDDDNVVDK